MTIFLLGWHYDSQGLSRVSDKRSPRGSPRARVDKDCPAYLTNAAREKLLEHASKKQKALVWPSSSRSKSELRSSHNSCTRSNDLGGSCSGLGPPWPKVQIKAQIQTTPRGMLTNGPSPNVPDHRLQLLCPPLPATSRVPDQGNTSSSPARTPAPVQLEHPPHRADFVHPNRYRIP